MKPVMRSAGTKATAGAGAKPDVEGFDNKRTREGRSLCMIAHSASQGKAGIKPPSSLKAMETTVYMVIKWIPLACWLISMVIFVLVGPRLRLWGPLSPALRKMTAIGTVFFFLGLALFLLQLGLQWFFQGHPI